MTYSMHSFTELGTSPGQGTACADEAARPKAEMASQCLAAVRRARSGDRFVEAWVMFSPCWCPVWGVQRDAQASPVDREYLLCRIRSGQSPAAAGCAEHPACASGSPDACAP